MSLARDDEKVFRVISDEFGWSCVPLLIILRQLSRPLLIHDSLGAIIEIFIDNFSANRFLLPFLAD